MKRNLLLLPAVTLFAGLSSMDVFAQNPVQNLKADVNFNRYVNLSWEAPLLEKGSEAEVTDDDSSYNLWKKVVFPADYGNVIQIDDYYLASKAYKGTDKLLFDRLDMNLNVIESVEVTGKGFVEYNQTGTSSMINVGNDIYSLCSSKNYRDTVFKFNLSERMSSVAFHSHYKHDITGWTYVPDLDGGNGGFVELNDNSACFLDMNGNVLDGHNIFFDELSLAEGEKLKLKALAYSDGIYYVVGTKGVKSGFNEKPYIWEFSADGHFIAERVDMTELMKLYFLPQHATVYADSSTGNKYLVVEVREVDEATYQYITVHYYYEIATSGNVLGYEVYLDDEKLTGEGFTATSFSDTLTVAGDYTYSVRAVYGSGLSDAETVNVQIKDPGVCNAPAGVKATVVNKDNVLLQWERPEKEDALAMKYYIYRNGELVGESFVPSFVDMTVAPGNHKYTVRAEYDNSGMSEDSEHVVVDMKLNIEGQVEKYAPRDLEAISYIDAESKARVDLSWKTPKFGPEATMAYSDMKAGAAVGDKVYGMGIKYPKGSLKHLDNYTLDSVSFVAGCAGLYRIVVYEGERTVAEQTLDSLSVKFDDFNTFALETPVKIDANKEYLIGVVTRLDSIAAVKGLKSVTASDAVVTLPEGSVSAIFPFVKDDAYQYIYFNHVGSEKGHYNVQAHFSALDNSGLYAEGSGFKGYAIYRNGEKLDALVKDSEEFTDIPGKDGDYTYTVASTWEGSEDLHSNAVSRNVTALYGAPDNLVATVDGSDITLNWNAPLSGAPFVKRWDSGKNAGKLGNKAGGTMYMATLFTTEDLKSFPGFSITNVEFFPAEYATFTIVVYSGEDLVYSQLVEEEELKVGEFNVIELDSPVLIDATKDLRVGYKVEYSANSRPCGLDETESADGKGNQLSMDGKYWMPASEQGVYNNWNIAFTVQYFNNTEVARIAPFDPASVEVVDAASLHAALSLSAEMTSSAQRSNLSGNTLAGYNVYRNGEKITASPVQDLTFSEVIAEGGDFEYYVGAVYTESEEMFSNRVSVSKTGVADVVSSAVAVYPNPATTEVHVSCGFDSYVVYDLSGRAVLRSDASGDVIGVGNLSAGQYLLVFAKDNMEYNRKITVVR